MTKISQDEAERKCANLRLESLHRHNDHEVFFITVIVTPPSKFYQFVVTFTAIVIVIIKVIVRALFIVIVVRFCWESCKQWWKVTASV